MKLFFLGDFAYDYDKVKPDIRNIAEYINENGLNPVINVEGPICDGTSKQIRKRGAHLHQSSAAIDALKELSTIGVTLSNNHMMDFGSKGCKSTIETLDAFGILHCGAGSNLNTAIEPMVIKDEKGETAVFNFGWAGEETVYAGKNRYGCSPRENAVVLGKVKEYAAKFPKRGIIVTLHWGFEFNTYPLPYDIELGHKLLDIDNVRIVIGHHPHCPQTVEEYKGKKIYYSLGNFYFSSRRKNFSKRKFPAAPFNRSDFGLGVVFDTVSGKTSDKVIFYDVKKDESYFIESAEMPEKHPVLDMNSREYSEIYKKGAQKGNPYLGTDEKANRRMTATFNLMRDILRYVPFAGKLLKLVKR